jgi:oligoendopeptidase F
MGMKRIHHALLVCAVMIAGCAPKKSDEPAQVDSLRSQAEGLIKAQSLMGWNSWAFGATSNQDSLYKANAGLFTLENIRLVQRVEQAETSAIQRKRLRYFLRYLATEYIAKQNAPLSDKVNNLESAATVTFEKHSIPYRQVSSMLANERNQKRRAGLYMALDPVLDSLNAIHQQIEESNRRLATELGFPSYNQMAQELKGFSLSGFRATCERVLVETESTYTRLLEEILLKQLRLRRENFFRYDFAPLFRRAQYDRYFAGEAMLETMKRTYSGLGITVEDQRNLRVDSEARPAKNPRAVCYPIDVPNDVRLSIKPIGGFDDYAALFHEMGHGQHYANTKEHAMEFKYLGEPTVTESFAFLSEYILSNQAWLRLQTRMPTAVEKDFLRFQAFHRLYFVRRYCAKFLYELQLHAGAASPDSLYSALQSRAIGHREIPSDRKRYLTDVDALFYSASYLRAWFLESQLNAMLTKDFGVNWFENPKAGEYLRSLWAQGDRLDGDELVKVLGFDAISPDVWMTEVKMMLLFSTQ